MNNNDIMHWLQKNKIGFPTIQGNLDRERDLNKIYLYDLFAKGYFGQADKVFIKPEKSIEIFTAGLN
jgi:hypothetical protein